MQDMISKKGYFYAILSQFCFVFWAIGATVAFKYYGVFTVIPLWFGFAATLGTLAILISGRFPKYIKTFKENRKFILISTFFDGLSVLLSFYILNLIGPSLQGFLGKISIMITIVLGIIFLNERFNKNEIISGIITIIGLIIITYATGEIAFIGLILVIIQGLFLALAKFTVKSKLVKNNVLYLATYRATFVFIYGLIFALSTNQFDFYWSYAILFATLPSTFSVLIGHILTYKAYRHLELSKATIINSLGPFLVAIVAFIFLGETLTIKQIFGGTVIVLGITLLSYFRGKKVNKEKIIINNAMK